MSEFERETLAVTRAKLRLLEERNRVLKQLAESQDWKKFLPPK